MCSIILNKDVVRVWRRCENSFTLNLGCIYIFIWQIREDKKFLLFIGGKWNGSRHLVFWSLETLTGLRDRVRGLIAQREDISTPNMPYLR